MNWSCLDVLYAYTAHQKRKVVKASSVQRSRQQSCAVMSCMLVCVCLVQALDCDDTDADYAAYDCVQTAAQALFGFRDMYTDTRMDVLFGEGPAAHLRVPTVRDMLMEKRGDMWRMFQGWLVISGLFEINDLRHVLRRYVATYLRMGIVPGGPMGHLEDPNGFQKAVQT